MMNAKELTSEIEQHLKDLVARTQAAKASKEVLEYLRFMAKFHRYSFHNTLSIWLHCPHATQVAGYATWKRLGRFVKKGERGIPILAPCVVRKAVTNDENAEPEEQVVCFKVVYVFDVSQTDGKPLPEAPITTAGDGKGLLPVVESVACEMGIEISYKPLQGSHHGTSFGGRSDIDEWLDEAGKVSVMLHELAHELLHRGPDRNETSREQKETEAEAVSFIVCSHFGIETAAPNYLALWDATEEAITQALQRVQKTAAQIIDKMEKIIASAAPARESMAS